jgi:DIM1 family U5 snRNP protein
MYELFDPCTVMFFFRNKARCAAFCAVTEANGECAALRLGAARLPSLCRSALTPLPCTATQHIMIDLGTGNNNKINWAFNEKQEMIDIIETVYRGGRKGRGLVVSPKDYSTKYRY